MKITNEIHEFPCGIYPRRLWIAVNASSSFLEEIFDEKFEDIDSTTAAYVMAVHKKTPEKLGGVLVRFGSRKDMSVSNMAHEATHASIEIFDYVDGRISYDNQEPFAYLVGWVTEMMNMVKTKNYDKD